MHPEPIPKRILLVEDEAIVALSEKHMIEKHGFEVVTVHSGEDAVQRALAEPQIDLVLMDIDLGSGIDGTEAARRILAERTLPVVFLTSHSEKEYVDRVKEITSYGYVLKNSGEFVLIESITMAFELFAAHRDLAQKEQRLSHIINDAPVGVFQSWADGTFRHMNQEMARILGFSSPELAVAHYENIATEVYVDTNRREELLERIGAQGTVRDFLFEAWRANGERANLRMNARLLYEDPDRGALISAFCLDETQRIHAERQLKHAYAQYRSVVRLAQEIIVRYDAEGHWTFLNNEACRFFGQPEEKLLGKRFWDYIHPEDRDAAYSAEEDMRRTGNSVEGVVNRQWTPNGWRVVEWNSAPILSEDGAYLGSQATGRDITEQQASQHRHMGKQKKWRTLFERATAGILLLDREQTIIEANPWAGELLEYERQELRGLNVHDLLDSDEVGSAPMENSAEYASSHRGPGSTETRFRTKSGRPLHVQISARELPHFSAGVSSLVMFHDITNRKRLEDALRRSNEQFQTIFESARDSIFIHDLDGTFLQVNSAACNRLGYSRRELLEMTPMEIDSREHAEQTGARIAEIAETGQSIFESEHVARDGTTIPVEVNASKLEYEGSPAILSIARDISDRKRAEQQAEEALAEQQRLMQELNHRVKNNLRMVSSLVELKDAALGDAVDLSDVSHQINAIHIVHQKLHQANDVRYVDLHGYLDDLLKTVFSSFTSKQVLVHNTVPHISVPTKTAVALGLIVNEIATNAIKYGFTSNEQARFHISLDEDVDEDHYVLTIGNTGHPLPKHQSIENAETLGFQLISALAAQLDGTIDLQHEPSPVFTLRLPRNQS